MTEAGVHCLPLPNPFFEGRTNAYVLAADPVTLIDTGIGTDDSFCALEGGLRAHGLALTDIRQIVLTHHHMDHFGQARRLRDLTGARVFVHHEDRDAVTRYDESLPEAVERIRLLLRQAGTPVIDIETVATLFLVGASRLARSVPAEPLADGQRLVAGGGELEVIHTPGHTLGCICLRFGRFLFSGDHVLPGISPNIGSDAVGARLLQRYLASLEKIRARQTADLLVLPGHGEPFTDLRGRVDQLRDHHHRRERQLLDLISRHGPQTIHELATAMFGKLEGYHIVLGAAETWAHVEKLVEDGCATREGNLFRAV